MNLRTRKRVTDFIHRNPIWVLYVRSFPETRCSCWNSFSGGSDYWHEECLGTGKVVRLEKVMCRRSMGYKEERDIALPGYVSQTHTVFYFPYYVMPKDNDIVVEVESWDGSRPVGIYRVYRVMVAVPMRQSEVSYYACGCNPHDAQRDKISEAIPRLPIVVLSTGQERDWRRQP